ncbi:OmpA family protein [Hymenobacter sp. BT523]|uniref:OmpA family protein n=1 Tax=Hymenobacter sp. BT523 TaxID=2795725 RepID=UPI0018EC9737|nr:OmpA family protein [Hymenobacter sp. BT523]MBJ6110005.1 OmpA family protein [Hymenobacter sp. BT523]
MKSRVLFSQMMGRVGCWLALFAGFVGCHSARVVPAISSGQPSAGVQLPEKPLVRVQGHFYGPKDSLTVVPGVAVDFSCCGTDAAVQHWRDTTKADGSYRVAMPAGRTYLVALSKNGKNIETQEFPVPESATDSVVVKNFYLNYDGPENPERWWPNIYFAIRRFDLQPTSLTTMDSVIRRLNATPNSGLLVEGHAEPFEVPRSEPDPERYLLRLGWRRAEAAYTHLLRKGISENRLVSFSYGAKRPAAPDDSPEHRQLNRRVEFKTVGLEFIPSKEEKLRLNGLSKTPAHLTKTPVSKNLKQASGRRAVPPKPVSYPSKSRR